MKRSKILCFLLLGIFATRPACAARFPNAVEKKVVLSGSATSSIAELFGVSPEKEVGAGAKKLAQVSLRLGRGDAWAIYLLKQDTKEKLYNDNEGSPPRFNVLDFSSASASSSSSLTISPFFLDLGTRGPSPKVGYFSFSSPFLSGVENSDQDDAWTKLLKRLMKEPGWNGQSETQYERTFSFVDGKEMSLQVFGAQDYAANKKGHTIIVTVHE